MAGRSRYADVGAFHDALALDVVGTLHTGDDLYNDNCLPVDFLHRYVRGDLGFAAIENGICDCIHPKERDTDDTNDTKVEPNDTNEEAILRILRTNPKATQKDVVEMLGVSLATVKRLMNSLQKAGKIKRKGSNRSGSWVVIDQKE